MKRATGQATRTVAGALHTLCALAFGLVLLGALLAGGLAWRLSRGPIESAWLATRIAREASAPGLTVIMPRVRVAWSLRHAIAVTAEDVTLQGAGRPAVRAASITAAIPVSALLRGKIRPDAVTIVRPELRLERDADGTLRLLGVDRSRGGGDPADAQTAIAGLEHIVVEDGHVAVSGLPSGVEAGLADLTLDLRRGAEGFSGAGAAIAQFGADQARVTLDADAAGGSTHVKLSAEPAVVAALSHLVDGLGDVRAPVGGTLSATLTPDLVIAALAAHVTAGAGAITINGQAMPLLAAVLDASGTADAVRVTNARITEGVPGHKPTTITLSAAAHKTPLGYAASVDVALDEARIADLPALWPPKIGGPGTRPWIVENVVAGVAHDVAFHVELAGPADLSDAVLTVATGTVIGDDVTFHWLRPVPPVEHSSARLKMLDPDTIVIALAGGQTRADGAKGLLTLKDGTVKLTGLAAKHQFATIEGDLSGAVGDAYALLREKRLHLFDHTNFELKDPSGEVTVNVHVFLPLEEKVTMDEVPIRAHAVTRDARLPGLLGGRDVDQGDVTIDATQDGLKVAGNARLAGIASQIAGAFDFRSGPPSQVQYQGSVTGRAEAAQVAAAGIDTGGRFGGAALLSATGAVRRDGAGSVSVRADLTPAALSAEPLDYRKIAGTQGAFAADITLAHGKVSGADNVVLTAPGLDIRGAAAAGAGPLGLRFVTIRVGGTDASGTITVPDDARTPVRADFSGNVLDLASHFAPNPAPPASARARPKPAASGLPYVVSAAFQRVMVADGQTMTGVSARAESDGTVISRLSVRGTVSAGRQPFSADIAPGANRTRTLAAQTADAGGFLRGVGVTGRLTGGALRLAGTFDDRAEKHPLRGTAEMTGFTLTGTPSVAKIVQALSIYGVADALRGPGLYFARLHAPFTYDADSFSLDDARAYSTSLGVTGTGSIDLAASRADMRGTIVPSYALNRLPGRIPLIGKFLSPEDNSGLFAAKFSVTGPLDNPDVSVNPFAALTPGALRNLFGAK